MKKKWLLLLIAGAVLASGCKGENMGRGQAVMTQETAAGENPAPEAPAAAPETSAQPQEAAEEKRKDTAFGPVEGTEKGEALVWYGIPYGKEPSGSLRWKAPLDPDVWTEKLSATDFKEPALQLENEAVIGTEDCLNLDVYSRKGAKKLPVMVFIHGGNNQTGNTRELIGTEMAVKNDMVFVSVNYRLGLLGFNCLPALMEEEHATGNFAMLDIAKALDWVRENIEQFGGDPENITVSGFSAGGRDVMAMLISPLFKGKFQKAVVFSGGMTVSDQELSAKKIAAAIAPLAVEDGKAGDETEAEEWLLGTGEEVRDYLYSISSERLSALMGNAGIRMNVFPHLYADGVVIPKEGFETDAYIDVPVLMLTGTTEFSMFAYGDSYYSGSGMEGLSEEELLAAKNFAIKYGSRMYGYFNTEASAEKMSSSYESPIYLCSVNYGDSSSAYPIPVYGSFHGIFIPMLSTENNYAPMLPDTFNQPGYVDMGNLFLQYLKNFLYTGDPNGQGLEAWSPWDEKTHLTMVLDAAEGKALAECKSVKTSYGVIMDEMDQDETISKEIKEKVIANVMNGRWFSGHLDQRYENKSLWVD